MPKQTLIASLLLLQLFVAARQHASAQDSLPRFTLQERNGLVIVGWFNPFTDLTELVIQRSLDSTKGFKSIVSMPDPRALSNGFLDRKVDAARHYYRIFYIRDGLRYEFTPASKAMKTDDNLGKETMAQKGAAAADLPAPAPTPVPTPAADMNGNAYAAMPRANRNDLKVGSQLRIEAQLPEEIFTPSALIFTNKDGNLIVALPDAGKRKYSLKVFRDEGMLLFDMKQIGEAQLLVDRSNFFHSGWFRYELYEGEKLKEQNRFFIPPAIQ